MLRLNVAYLVLVHITLHNVNELFIHWKICSMFLYQYIQKTFKERSTHHYFNSKVTYKEFSFPRNASFQCCQLSPLHGKFRGRLQIMKIGKWTWGNVKISDFTWNQFRGLKKCKICHFNTFTGSEFWLPLHFCTF